MIIYEIIKKSNLFSIKEENKSFWSNSYLTEDEVKKYLLNYKRKQKLNKIENGR